MSHTRNRSENCFQEPFSITLIIAKLLSGYTFHCRDCNDLILNVYLLMLIKFVSPVLFLFRIFLPYVRSLQYEICSDLFWFVLICSDLFWFVLICSDLFWFVLICSDLFWFVLICSDLFWFACGITFVPQLCRHKTVQCLIEDGIVTRFTLSYLNNELRNSFTSILTR